MTEDMKPAIGQIWQEVDPRSVRYVRIEKIDGDAVAIRTVVFDGTIWVHARRAASRWAATSRFNGKRGGYSFYMAAP